MTKCITLRKILLSCVILLFLINEINAVNTQKQYTGTSEEYNDVVNLCILTGTALPSSMTPVSGRELLMALERIDYETLNQNLRQLYDSVYKRLSEPEIILDLDPFFINTTPSIGLETYLHSATEPWMSSNDWTNPYRDRLKLAELPVEIGLSDYFYGRVIPDISMQLSQETGDPNREGDTEFNKLFTTNANLSIGMQRSMPLVSEAVIGTDYLHLYIGRNRQSLGLGYTGNLMLGDNFIYQDFAKFTINTNYFTYNLSLTVFNTQKNTPISDYSPLGSTKLNSTTFSGKKQYRVINNYQINLFDKATIYLNFGNLFDSEFDLRMINPFYIMHNIFNFTKFGGNDYGNGAAIEANNHFSLALSYPFVPGWSLYLEAMIDQFQLIGENSSTAKEPPNALGLLLNLTNASIINEGILKTHAEVVYTTPSLYLNEKYVDERESHSLDVKKRQIDMAMEIRERMMRQEHENKDRDYAREQDALDKEHAREQDSLNRSHMRNMEIMAQSREIKKDSYLHEENMANIRKGYSEGQIMAEQLSSLDAGAQMEFAKSLSSKKEEELAKAKQQMMDDYMKMMVSDRDKMLDFARDAMKMNVAAAGAQISNAETLRDKYKEDADRYREDAYHQQSRVDQNQDKALDYTTRVTTADVNVENNSNKGFVGNSKNVIYCPYCNSENDPENNVCGECGYRLK